MATPSVLEAPEVVVDCSQRGVVGPELPAQGSERAQVRREAVAEASLILARHPECVVGQGKQQIVRLGLVIKKANRQFGEPLGLLVPTGDRLRVGETYEPPHADGKQSVTHRASRAGDAQLGSRVWLWLPASLARQTPGRSASSAIEAAVQ